jgi:hypothetical protein
MVGLSATVARIKPAPAPEIHDMRMRLLALVGAAAFGLAGCAHDEDAPKPQVAATVPVTGVDTDIRKILTAGGLDANSPSAPRGAAPATAATVQAPAPPTPSAETAAPAAQAPSAPASPAAAPGKAGKAAGKHGRKMPETIQATVTPISPLEPAPPGRVVAGPLAAAPAQAPQFDPSKPLPRISPYSPPETTVRLPMIAESPSQIPADAPRQATVTVAPTNYNFLNGVGDAAAQRPPQPAAQSYAPQLAFPPGSVVSGPDARAILQPLLNPDTLVAAPRVGRAPRSRAAETPARHAAHAAQPSPAPAAAPKTAPETAPETKPEPGTPTVRRF